MRNENYLGSYERRILKAFVDRFQSSAHRKGGRRVRIGNWEKILPEAYTDAGEKTAFLEAMESCALRGVISLSWKKFRRGDELDAAYLEDDVLLFKLMDLEHPDDLLHRIVETTGGKEWNSPASKDVLEFCKRALSEKGTPPFNNPGDAVDLITLFEHLERRESPLPLRALSVKLFNDSKRIEVLLSGSAGILKQIKREESVSSLERSFPECGIKGDIAIEFNDGRVWNLRNETLSLSIGSVEKIRRITDGNGLARPVLSVENKETFHLIHRPDHYCGYIFCHGHINSAVRLMIQTLLHSGIELHHFGDMDPEGILIFIEINELCKSRCVPFRMTVETYRRYQSYGYNLSAAQLSRLPRDAGPLSTLAEAIHTSGKGVEQEIVDTSAD